MSETRVRWGIISTARIGTTAFIPAMRETSNGEISAVASRERDKGEAFASEYDIPNVFEGYEAMLASDAVDAVYNALPNTMHAEWTIKAAEHGKHIFCEKPLAVSSSEAKAMADACEANGVHLLEAFVFYFHEQTSKIRQLLDEGEIGELLQMAVHFCFRLPRDRPNIRLDKDLGGGALLDVGSYAITFVRFAFDEEPVSVQASVCVDPEYGVDTRTSAILEFAEGRSAVVQVGMDSPVGPGAILMTSKGVLEVPQPFHPRTDAQLVVRRIGDYPTRADVVEKMPFGSDGQPFAPALEHFNDCVLDGSPLLVSPRNAIGTLRVIDAIHQSAQEGRRVDL